MPRSQEDALGGGAARPNVKATRSGGGGSTLASCLMSDSMVACSHEELIQLMCGKHYGFMADLDVYRKVHGLIWAWKIAKHKRMAMQIDGKLYYCYDKAMALELCEEHFGPHSDTPRGKAATQKQKTALRAKARDATRQAVAELPQPPKLVLQVSGNGNELVVKPDEVIGSLSSAGQRIVADGTSNSQRKARLAAIHQQRAARPTGVQ